MVFYCLIQENCLNVCRSSQICKGIIFLELSSEGLFIQLKKLFSCWRTWICTTIQQWHSFLIYLLFFLLSLEKSLSTSLGCTPAHLLGPFCLLSMSKYIFSGKVHTLLSYINKQKKIVIKKEKKVHSAMIFFFFKLLFPKILLPRRGKQLLQFLNLCEYSRSWQSPDHMGLKTGNHLLL